MDYTVRTSPFPVPYENNRLDKSKPSGLVEKAVRFYQANLNETIAPKAIQYLKERKITGPTAKKFNIGYAQDKWDGLFNHLEAEASAKELYSAINSPPTEYCKTTFLRLSLLGEKGTLYS